MFWCQCWCDMSVTGSVTGDVFPCCWWLMVTQCHTVTRLTRDMDDTDTPPLRLHPLILNIALHTPTSVKIIFFNPLNSSKLYNDWWCPGMCGCRVSYCGYLKELTANNMKPDQGQQRRVSDVSGKNVRFVRNWAKARLGIIIISSFHDIGHRAEDCKCSEVWSFLLGRLARAAAGWSLPSLHSQIEDWL